MVRQMPLDQLILSICLIINDRFAAIVRAHLIDSIAASWRRHSLRLFSSSVWHSLKQRISLFVSTESDCYRVVINLNATVV